MKKWKKNFIKKLQDRLNDNEEIYLITIISGTYDDREIIGLKLFTNTQDIITEDTSLQKFWESILEKIEYKQSSYNLKLENGRYGDKEEIKNIRKDVGLVFQSFNLFPHKSVIENIIEAPIRVLKEEKESVIKRVGEILDFLGLSDKSSAYPCELSGGRKQR